VCKRACVNTCEVGVSTPMCIVCMCLFECVCVCVCVCA